MNINIFADLIDNATLLLVLGLIYDTLSREKRTTVPVLNKISSGVIIGAIAIFLMLIPVKWEAGIIFDTRTILLGLTGLFFGTIPTLIAMAIAGAYRISLGGAGTVTGVATIITSGLIGLTWRHYRFRMSKEKLLPELYLFGVVVHSVMIICMFLLPQPLILKTISAIILPVIIIYPICTALLGKLLTGRMRRHLVEEELQDSILRFSQLAQQNRTVTWEVDAEGLFTYVSPVAETVFRYHPDELIGKIHFYDLHPEEGRGEFKEAALAEFKRKKEFENFTSPILAKDGKVVWVLMNALPILTEEGDLKGYRGWDKDISDRKQTEESLRESEIQYRNLADAGLALIWRSGTDKICYYFNKTWLDFTGRTLEQETGYGWTEGVYPEDFDQCLKTYVTAFDKREKFEMEYRLRNVSGEYRWILDMGTPNYNIKNEFIGYIGHCFDITERKQAEAELQDSKEKYRVLVNNLSSGVVVHAPDSSVIFSNPMASTLLGLTKDQMRGKEAMNPAWNFLRENNTPMPFAEYPVNQVLSSGYPIANLVLGIRRPDLPGPVWVQCNAYPVAAADGTLLQVVVTFTDISERKQIEEVQSYLLKISSLNTGEDFFESLASYLASVLSMDYVCIDTLHGDCLSARTLAIYCDGKFEDNVEYTLKDTPCGDVAGKEICVFPREVRSLFPQDEALQDLQAESYVGTTLWSFDMKPIGLIAVIGRKELNSSHFAESVLKLVSIRAAGELERRQAEEEKLLLEQQFQQTQKLESLGVLAGGIAHDFNNILAIIMGYCSLTKMDYGDAEKHIPEIEKAAERAAALCRQMLAYAGKASLSQAQVNTLMLVDEMVTMLKTTIQKNVVIKAELGTDIPFIMGDASQIRQVVMNLVINAAEAIGNAEGAIAVKLVKAEFKAEHTEKDHLGLIIPAGLYILFEVTDNGCGMDEETSRKIFEPFYTTKFTGRGLGMSAVLGIIKAHNGALQLESHPGQGATFKVYLPVQFSKSESEEAQQKASSVPWHGSGTILLAEDEEQVKSIAIILLQGLGFTVLDAENGKEALELYQQNVADISLVITDMGMPVMNGYELFYKLKQLDPQLPIIISSGFGEGDIDSKIPREEIAGLINKPYNFDQLREVLRGVVEGAK